MSSRKCMSIDAIVIGPASPQAPPSPPEWTVGAPSSPPLSPVMESANPSSSTTTTTTTTADRRYRNKIASAKYRAKKQQNMRSMSAKLAQISAKNATLQRQLAQALEDNDVLRRLCKSLMGDSTTLSIVQQNAMPSSV